MPTDNPGGSVAEKDNKVEWLALLARFRTGRLDEGRSKQTPHSGEDLAASLAAETIPVKLHGWQRMLLDSLLALLSSL